MDGFAVAYTALAKLALQRAVKLLYSRKNFLKTCATIKTANTQIDLTSEL